MQLNLGRGEQLIKSIVREEAAQNERGKYPQVRRILPTRLGNMLRSFEDSVGRQYRLKSIPTAPHFSLIIPERHAQYLADCGTEMDTAIRMCTVSLLATAAGVVFLLSDGVWLLLVLAPYALAYLAYRAAVSAAEGYGIAVRTIVDLNRFLLYESLGLERPESTTREREQNERLISLLRGDTSVVMAYAPKEQPPAAPPTAPEQ